MCNYLSRFIPKLSQTSKPLRCLTENNTDFQWGASEQTAFNKVKELISEDQLLAFYDVTKPVVIQCDASGEGLGATLLQEGQPVTCWSCKNLSRVTCLLVLLVHALSSFLLTTDHFILSSPSSKHSVSYMSFTLGPTVRRKMANLVCSVASSLPIAVRNSVNSLLNRRHKSLNSPPPMGSGARYFSIISMSLLTGSHF